MLHQHAIETDWTVEGLDISPRERVLEVGFGPGRGLSLALQKANSGRVIGVDISPAMLGAARRLNRAAIESGRLNLEGGDAAALPFRKESFDKIFSIHTSYFWPRPEVILQEFFQLLVPGGRAVITFAAAKQRATGEWDDLDVRAAAERLVESFSSDARLSAKLEHGPTARGYGNVGLVIDKAEAGG